LVLGCFCSLWLCFGLCTVFVCILLVFSGLAVGFRLSAFGVCRFLTFVCDYWYISGCFCCLFVDFQHLNTCFILFYFILFFTAFGGCFFAPFLSRKAGLCF
jgi:hypothetical protein